MQNYTDPKLCKSKNGWYVYLRFNHKLKKFKKGLNKIKDPKDKIIVANEIIRQLKIKLKNGWSPFSEELTDSKKYNLLLALDFAIEKKKAHVSTKTFLGYRSMIGFIKKAAKDLSLDYLNINELKRAHVKLILERVQIDRSWSSKAYNKGLNYFRATLSELLQWDIIETNPAFSIKALKVPFTRANITPTPEEHLKIKDCLLVNHAAFYNFVVMLFHTGIRPKELLQIKLFMIDQESKKITLPPEITKTDRERVVPINPHLSEMLSGMEIKNHPSEFYLFGAFKYNHKHRSSLGLDFIPAPSPIARDTATKKWNTIIKQHLGIQVNLYAMKHAGADAKILAGIGLESLQELYGHTSKLTTSIYAQSVKEVYRKEIIDKSPEF